MDESPISQILALGVATDPAIVQKALDQCEDSVEAAIDLILSGEAITGEPRGRRSVRRTLSATTYSPKQENLKPQWKRNCVEAGDDCRTPKT